MKGNVMRLGGVILIGQDTGLPPLMRGSLAARERDEPDTEQLRRHITPFVPQIPGIRWLFRLVE